MLMKLCSFPRLFAMAAMHVLPVPPHNKTSSYTPDKALSMRAPAVVYVSPVRANIAYFVVDKPKGGIGVAFRPIVEKLKQGGDRMGRIMIFCRTYTMVISIHQYFISALGEYSTEPKGSRNYVVNRVVDMYTHYTHPTVKNKLLKQFTSPSPLRVIIATIAFGMGIDCPASSSTGVFLRTQKHTSRRVDGLEEMEGFPVH